MWKSYFKHYEVYLELVCSADNTSSLVFVLLSAKRRTEGSIFLQGWWLSKACMHSPVIHELLAYISNMLAIVSIASKSGL